MSREAAEIEQVPRALMVWPGYADHAPAGTNSEHSSGGAEKLVNLVPHILPQEEGVNVEIAAPGVFAVDEYQDGLPDIVASAGQRPGLQAMSFRYTPLAEVERSTG